MRSFTHPAAVEASRKAGCERKQDGPFGLCADWRLFGTQEEGKWWRHGTLLTG